MKTKTITFLLHPSSSFTLIHISSSLAPLFLFHRGKWKLIVSPSGAVMKLAPHSDAHDASSDSSRMRNIVCVSAACHHCVIQRQKYNAVFTLACKKSLMLLVGVACYLWWKTVVATQYYTKLYTTIQYYSIRTKRYDTSILIMIRYKYVTIRYNMNDMIRYNTIWYCNIWFQFIMQ